MKFIRAAGTDELENALTDALGAALESSKSVLWLVPGGSNIAVAIAVMNRLDEQHTSKLTLLLTDERYGQPGHKDSNYSQLKAGGFKTGTAHFTDLLTGSSLELTVQAYADKAQQAFKDADTVIGFFGMGPDSHIAGILPSSPAATESETWAIGYEAENFTRMTLTPFALSHINTAFVGAFGREKKTALEKLCTTTSSIAEQPSRILCHLPSVTIFNDQVGKI